MVANHSSVPGIDPEDRDAVLVAVLDYIEGWYAADPERMERALHDDLVKRTPTGDGPGAEDLRVVSKTRMVELTRSAGGSAETEPAISVVVDDVSGEIASARCYCVDFVDYLHLAKVAGVWRITHDLFRARR